MKKLIKYGWGAIVIAFIIFYLSCLATSDDMPSTTIPYADKIVHFAMYFGLSLVASSQYIYLKKGQISIVKLIIFAILIPIVYGGIVEMLQENFFNRTGDWADLGADMFGSLATLPLAMWFRKLMINKQKNA